MLHDRTSWPVITLPAALGRAGSAGQLVAGHRRGGSLQEHQATLEEEEDVSRGDALDFMTPRDISRMRYEQHHEWMEEILESHYASKNIIPSDLGLGRKGTLESLTNGFFAAPVSVVHEPVNGNVGKLPPGKSEEFAKHAEQKLAEMQAELDKMKQDHARRMEKLKRTTALGAAERKLRNMSTSDDSYKTIGAQVQDLVGREIKNVQSLSVVSKGGMQDIRPAVRSPEMFAQNASQNTTQAQSSQNQQQRPPQQPQQQQPNQQYQQQQQQARQAQPQQQTQQNQQNQQPQPQVQNQQQQTGQAQTPQQPQQQPQPMTTQEKPMQDSDHSDAKGQTPPVAQPGQEQSPAQAQSMPETSDTPIENNDAVSLQNDLDMEDSGDQDLQIDEDNNNDAADWDMLVDQSGDNEQGAEEQSNNEQDSGSRQASPANQAPNPSNNNTPGGDATDFDMVTDFDNNMDTAGDALADYGGGDDDLNLEDSAFGDAFHSHEQDMA